MDIESLLNPERKLLPEPSRRRGLTAASDGLARLQREALRIQTAVTPPESLPVLGHPTAGGTSGQKEDAAPAEAAAPPMDTERHTGGWLGVASAAVGLFERLQQEECVRGCIVPWVRAMARCGGNPQPPRQPSNKRVTREAEGATHGRRTSRSGGGGGSGPEAVGPGSTLAGSSAGNCKRRLRMRPGSSQFGERQASAPGFGGGAVDAGSPIQSREQSTCGEKPRRGSSGGSVLRCRGAGMDEGRTVKVRRPRGRDKGGTGGNGPSRGPLMGRVPQGTPKPPERITQSGMHSEAGKGQCDQSRGGEEATWSRVAGPGTSCQSSGRVAMMRCRGAGPEVKGESEWLSRPARSRQTRYVGPFSASQGDKCALECSCLRRDPHCLGLLLLVSNRDDALS
jgi:hypothetical protein